MTTQSGRAIDSPRATSREDRLVLTNVVDNVDDVFARSGRLDTVTVQRTRLGRGGSLLAEHGLAYHLESLRGAERREILLDFSLTDRNLSNNYGVLGIDPSRADALVLSHGHLDHYGALPDLARALQGRARPGLTVYAGGEAGSMRSSAASIWRPRPTRSSPGPSTRSGRSARTTSSRCTAPAGTRSWRPTTPCRSSSSCPRPGRG